MTVDELIRLLGSYPPHMRVVVNGYEDGWDDLSPEQMNITKIQLNTGVHQWEGRHGEPPWRADSSADPSEIEEALVLSRVSY